MRTVHSHSVSALAHRRKGASELDGAASGTRSDAASVTATACPLWWTPATPRDVAQD